VPVKGANPIITREATAAYPPVTPRPAEL
jgi:hypothetical protein